MPSLDKIKVKKRFKMAEKPYKIFIICTNCKLGRDSSGEVYPAFIERGK
jgi:hypothetical protein